MGSRKIGFIGAVLALALAGTSCDRAEPTRRNSGAGAKVSTGGVSLPVQIVGLQVKPEDVSKQFEQAERAYVSSLGLFSLRENDLVRATLQVSRLNAVANPRDSNFRALIINRLGTTTPETLLVGKVEVYATSGTDQVIYGWFEERSFFVLTTHRDFEFPRTLLRRIIEQKQKA